jgi:hypothetical protein
MRTAARRTGRIPGACIPSSRSPTHLVLHDIVLNESWAAGYARPGTRLFRRWAPAIFSLPQRRLLAGRGSGSPNKSRNPPTFIRVRGVESEGLAAEHEG